MLDYLRREKSGLLETIRETKKFEDETRSGLEDAVDAFKQQFKATGEENLAARPRGTPGSSRPRVEQEKIVKQKR